MRKSTVAIAMLFAATCGLSANAANRAFVASTGSDANASASCAPTSPCRSFATAMNVVDDGGEVVALDAAGYGPVDVTKSVSFIGNPGAYAGIAASSGTAVNIAVPGVKVVLRNLDINSTGASTGVDMSAGDSLTIDHCVISNYASDGVFVHTAAKVRISETTVRENANGIHFDRGAVAELANVKALGNTAIALWADSTGSEKTIVSVSDSIASGGVDGFAAYQTLPAGSVEMAVTRSTASDNSDTGFASAYAPEAMHPGTILRVSASMASGNGVGFYVDYATMYTSGTNAVWGNEMDTLEGGTLTVVPAR